MKLFLKKGIFMSIKKIIFSSSILFFHSFTSYASNWIIDGKQDAFSLPSLVSVPYTQTVLSADGTRLAAVEILNFSGLIETVLLVFENQHGTWSNIFFSIITSTNVNPNYGAAIAATSDLSYIAISLVQNQEVQIFYEQTLNNWVLTQTIPCAFGDSIGTNIAMQSALTDIAPTTLVIGEPIKSLTGLISTTGGLYYTATAGQVTTYNLNTSTNNFETGQQLYQIPDKPLPVPPYSNDSQIGYAVSLTPAISPGLIGNYIVVSIAGDKYIDIFKLEHEYGETGYFYINTTDNGSLDIHGNPIAHLYISSSAITSALIGSNLIFATNNTLSDSNEILIFEIIPTDFLYGLTGLLLVQTMTGDFSNGYLGTSLSLNNAGTLLAVGQPGYNPNYSGTNPTGNTIILANNTRGVGTFHFTGAWDRIATIETGANNGFGSSVAFNAAGNILAIGAASNTDETRSIYVFKLLSPQETSQVRHLRQHPHNPTIPTVTHGPLGLPASSTALSLLDQQNNNPVGTYQTMFNAQ